LYSFGVIRAQYSRTFTELGSEVQSVQEVQGAPCEPFGPFRPPLFPLT
jgi:hypothetical protein